MLHFVLAQASRVQERCSSHCWHRSIDVNGHLTTRTPPAQSDAASAEDSATVGVGDESVPLDWCRHCSRTFNLMQSQEEDWPELEPDEFTNRCFMGSASTSRWRSSVRATLTSASSSGVGESTLTIASIASLEQSRVEEDQPESGPGLDEVRVAEAIRTIILRNSNRG